MNLTYKGNIIINNEYQFAPRELKINYESLASDNSGRTLDGVMRIYWVFNKIRKLEITLAPTTPQMIQEIFSRVQGQEYDITYFDLIENDKKTIHCYTSNSHADCYSGRVKNGLYEGATFNAIEIAGEHTNPDINPLIVPNISTTTGILTMTIRNTPDEFSRGGDNLFVEENTPGVTYEISEGDLIRNESEVS